MRDSELDKSLQENLCFLTDCRVFLQFFLGKEKVFWLTHDFMETKGIERYNGLMFRYIV